jgi:hypothetical protein
MPIINAVMTNWLKGKVASPYFNVGAGQPAITVPFASFSSKQISDRSIDTAVVSGKAYERVWNVGHTYWQIDFSIPIIVSDQYPTWPHAALFTGYLSAALQALNYDYEPYPGMGDVFLANTLQDKWDFNKTGDLLSNGDFMIQKFSIDITEDNSLFSATIIATTDPRHEFNVEQTNPAYGALPDWLVYRLAKPYDFVFPDNSIGSPLGYSQLYYNYDLTKMPNNTSYTSLLREFHYAVQANIVKIPSIGIPTSRPFLGVDSIGSTGSIKYVPLYRENFDIQFQQTGANFAPAGWTVDYQAMDYIVSSANRYGGKLYVAGKDLSSYLYVGLNLRQDIFPVTPVINGIAGNTPIGPVSTSNWGLEVVPNTQTAVSVEFVTSPGLTAF